MTTDLLAQTDVPSHKIRQVPVSKLTMLNRNPQYLTPKQMESLKESIRRDGFVVPILVRPIDGGKRYEVVSGNHRFLAARELGLKQIPAIVAELDERQAKRLAINLNTVHGEPTAALMAPYLAELDDALLREIHLEKSLLDDIKKFDTELKDRIASLQAPAEIARQPQQNEQKKCVCPKCGTGHFVRATENSK